MRVKANTMMPLAATVLLMVVGAANAVQVGYIHTKTTLLSGAIGACDPSPNASTCVGGLASVSAFARSIVRNGTASFVVIVPALDYTSAFTSMHPHNKGVNVDVYRRIGSQQTMNASGVALSTYLIEASIAASTKVNLRYLPDPRITPLATTIITPGTSPWRSLSKPAMYVNISSGMTLELASLEAVFRGEATPSPTMALLHIDDSSRSAITASAALSPVSAGPAVGLRPPKRYLRRHCCGRGRANSPARCGIGSCHV